MSSRVILYYYLIDSSCVIERFLGLVHVSDTVATSLEVGIDSLFSTYGLSVSSLRGQGYDGASNMRGEFNGLRSLIQKRSPDAHYVHCFAHQLQLTFVAVSKNHTSVGSFFNTITRLCNVVGGSCKRKDVFRESQRKKIIEGIANEEIITGRGLLCMACLDSRDSFSAFDVKKLLCLAKHYPSEFSGVVLYEIERQLENFIVDVRLDEKFVRIMPLNATHGDEREGA
ncbi:hypothetical protein OROGR_019669 [Orobanche gracilis]